ncbi:hypothetical protein GGF46_003390 [Coemansia sp. RSA 552]|nr:hypothetical protein GGF46_003390 [Coemansia sp. RSA 552]
MGFVVGLTAAIVGNVVIGAGQCLQKYGLNQLERQWQSERTVASGLSQGRGGAASYYSSVGIRARSGSVGSSGAEIASSGGGPRPRYTSRAWVLGLLLNYAGEMFGNSLALSYLSPSVVAPLGMVSVVVSLVLAGRFLGERISSNQRFGILVIAMGVGCILLVAPRGSGASSAAELVKVVEESGVLRIFFLGYLALGLLGVWINAGHQSLFGYVLAAALFGSMNVMVAKLLTMHMRLGVAGVPGPADVAMYGAQVAMRGTRRILGLTLPQILTLLVMGLSVVGQETMRQKALGKYPVLQFQPVFFATYNVVATLGGLILFRELQGWLHALVFSVVFMVGIGMVVYGSRYLQKAKSVVLPSHIKLSKENLYKTQ